MDTGCILTFILSLDIEIALRVPASSDDIHPASPSIYNNNVPTKPNITSTTNTISTNRFPPWRTRKRAFHFGRNEKIDQQLVHRNKYQDLYNKLEMFHEALEASLPLRDLSLARCANLMIHERVFAN